MGAVDTLREQLDDISADLDATTAAWAAAGHPFTGSVADAREAVFDRLHRWNARAGALPSGHKCSTCAGERVRR